jgi:hypothetical protein
VADRCRFNGTDAVFIDPSSRWQNGWVESINGRLRDEYLNSQRFNSLLEAKVLLEDRRIAYNINRPQQRARLDHPGRVRRGLAPPTTAHTRVAGGSTIGVPSPSSWPLEQGSGIPAIAGRRGPFWYCSRRVKSITCGERRGGSSQGSEEPWAEIELTPSTAVVSGQ